MGLGSERFFMAASWQSQHLWVKKTKKKMKKKLMRSKLSLIRPNCVQKYFWSDPRMLEEIMIRPNCARSRLWSDFSDQIDLWSDHLQTIVQTVVRSNFLPDPVILVWEHTGVRSTGSDHKPIWLWASTWELIINKGTSNNAEMIRNYYTANHIPTSLWKLWCFVWFDKNDTRQNFVKSS